MAARTDINTLYLSYDGMTDPLGSSQVIPYLQGLSELGYRITLVSFEKPERAADRPAIARKLKESGIDWRPLEYRKNPPVVSTLLDIRDMKRLAFRLHQQKRFALTHCRGYIAPFVGEALSARLGVPFVFDMRAFFADERRDSGLWPPNSPIYGTIYGYFKRKEREWLGKAGAVVSLTHNARQIINRWPSFERLDIRVIPCCADTALFSPENAAKANLPALRARLDLPEGRFTLAYLGSIGTWYMLPEMMAFFKRLLLRKPEAVFLFVTRHPREEIEAAAHAAGVPTSALRVTPASREEVPGYLALADLGIFFIKDYFSKKASSPVKQGEMMAMGLPVVCNSGVGDTDFVVEKYRSGLLVKGFDDSDYDAALDRLDEALALDRQAIRQGAIDFYDLRAGVEQYAAIYRQLAGVPRDL